ncbi:unnamed protein product [Bursaphelenchus okinawaensis]|uniref:Fatty-acid and retinol-binding protein 1 n=1 Tax=Bursaphelenchus okinawaensis TaxID=465554 RepID=A0A811L307_9BILA|nr:unnamed protein product [Bursaphelenchus okinawaensis]CAG9116609.1 unnamed protein product [Bursaphelenchus okinawaensis]
MLGRWSCFIFPILLLNIDGNVSDNLKDRIEKIMEIKAENYTINLSAEEKELFLGEANLDSQNSTRTKLVMQNEQMFSKLLHLLQDSFSDSGEVTETASNFLIHVMKNWPKVISDAKDTQLYDGLLKDYQKLMQSDQQIVNAIYPDMIKTLNLAYWNSLLLKIPPLHS